MGKFKVLPVIVMVLLMILMGGSGHAQTVNSSAVRPADAPYNNDLPVLSVCPTWYSSPTCNDPVSTTVVNIGEIDTDSAPGGPNFTFVNFRIFPGFTYAPKQIPNIPAGASIGIPSPAGTPAGLAAAPAGPFAWQPVSNTDYIEIVVDPFDQIPEYNNSNNTASRSLPDLEPVELTVGGTSFGTYVTGSAHIPSPARGKQTYINLKIANRGQMPPTYYRIQWRDEQPAGTVVV